MGLPALACFSLPGAAWDVKKGEEGRYKQARKVCRQLTDGEDPELAADLFENCMTRRGFKRKWWGQQIFPGLVQS